MLPRALLRVPSFPERNRSKKHIFSGCPIRGPITLNNPSSDSPPKFQKESFDAWARAKE